MAIWPFRHVGLKLLAIGLGLSLWMVVSGEETLERALRVPLELQQFPAGLELLGEPPANVDVRVRGGSGVLSRLSAGDVVAVIDLRGIRPGRRLLSLTSEQVRAPSGVEVVQVLPSTIVLVFENAGTAQVPIVPTVEGRPAPGFVVGKRTVDPPTIEITGPQTAVARTNEAVTEPVSVAGARAAVTETVTVGLMDPAVRLRTPHEASVTVEVLPAPVERTLTRLPVHLRNLGVSLSAQAIPVVADVTLRGSRDAIDRVDADEVSVYVNLAGLGSGQYSLTVHVDALPDAGVTRVEPSTVQVRITSAKN